MKKPEARIGSGVGSDTGTKCLSGAGVCVGRRSSEVEHGVKRMGQKSQVPIGDRCVFSEQEVVGGRCASNGKEKTQPRTDDLSS